MLMFLQNPDTRSIVDSMYFQVGKRGADSIGLDNPCVGPREIAQKFIKGDMRIISDVWYPLMHVVKPDHLLHDGF